MKSHSIITTTINPKGLKWGYFSEEGSSEVNVLLGQRVKPFAWGNAALDNGAQIKAFANAVNDVKTLANFWFGINPDLWAAGAGVGTEHFQYDSSGNLMNQEEIAARGYLGSSIVDMLQSYVNTNGGGEITSKRVRAMGRRVYGDMFDETGVITDKAVEYEPPYS